MLQVRRDLCLGCELCAQTCPRQAIWLLWGKAEIYQNRCDLCRQCVEVCPQNAIVDVVLVSKDELQAMVTTLKQRADVLIEKIERLGHYHDSSADTCSAGSCAEAKSQKGVNHR